MRKINFLVWAISILLTSCSGVSKESNEQPGWDVTIRGKVGFPGIGEIKIGEMRSDKPKPWEDTIKLKSNYTFEKKLRITEAGYYQLNFYNAQFVNVILDKKDLEVNVDGNSQSGFFEVKGSPDLELLAQVQKIVKDAQSTKEVSEIEAQFQVAVREKNEAKILATQQQYQSVMSAANDQVADFLEKQPPSLGLITVLQGRGAPDIDKYFPLYLAVADKFRKEWPQNYYAKEFVTFVDKQKVTAIGQPAPEISLPDPDGKIITLSSFKGKYVLIDFWAKWCGPCRTENPNVVKAYHQFKGKGFDILGVSLDRNREDWVKAIKEDGLVWHHVSDLKYYDSKAAADYNVNGIPFSILVDPRGIIVAKNLRGSELQRKLAEVLN